MRVMLKVILLLIASVIILNPIPDPHKTTQDEWLAHGKVLIRQGVRQVEITDKKAFWIDLPGADSQAFWCSDPDPTRRLQFAYHIDWDLFCALEGTIAVIPPSQNSVAVAIYKDRFVAQQALHSAALHWTRRVK